MVSHGKYRSDIDGLRAVAVLIVLFFHARLGVTGGFVGVDVFFVISGYLITGLILQDFDAGKFSLLQFWERRVRRILPALAVVIVATIIGGWILCLPGDYADFGKSLIAQSLLVSNFYFFFHSNYFDTTSEILPLLHTWSLAVEEQFYFFFPLLLFALRNTPREITARILLVLGVGSLALSIYSSYYHPMSNFFLLPSRAWELLVGSFLATRKSSGATGQLPRELVALAGISAIFYSAFFYTLDTRFPGLSATIPCLGAGAVIWANGPNLTWVGRFLSLPAVVFVGLISYSLYLWHWPILVYGRYWSIVPDAGSPQVHALWLLAVSFVAAVLSWRFVETPFRKRKLLQSRAQIFTAGGCTLATLTLVGCLIVFANGFPSRFSPQTVAYAAGLDDRGMRPNLELRDVRHDKYVEIGSADKAAPVRVFIWGDSHAMAVLTGMDALCREHNVRGLAATHSATAPLLDFDGELPWSLKQDAIPFANTVLHFVQTTHPHDVLLVAKWSSYGDRAPLVHERLLATIHALKQTGTRVWVLRQVPRQDRNVPRSLAWNSAFGKDESRIEFPLDSYNKEALAQDPILAAIPADEATVIDADSYFFDPNHHFIVEDGGMSLFFDHQHISSVGAMRIRPAFEPIFND